MLKSIVLKVQILLQVSNIAPQATRDQMITLFTFVGKVEDCRLYPSVRDAGISITSRYVNYSVLRTDAKNLHTCMEVVCKYGIFQSLLCNSSSLVWINRFEHSGSFFFPYFVESTHSLVWVLVFFLEYFRQCPEKSQLLKFCFTLFQMCLRQIRRPKERWSYVTPEQYRLHR